MKFFIYPPCINGTNLEKLVPLARKKGYWPLAYEKGISVSKIDYARRRFNNVEKIVVLGCPKEHSWDNGSLSYFNGNLLKIDLEPSINCKGLKTKFKDLKKLL